MDFKNKKVLKIKKEETYEWFKKLHYAKRLPITSHAFGLYNDNDLIGVVSYGFPTGRTVLEAMTSKEYEHPILELNRLCLLKNKKNYASFLIGRSLKLLPKPNIIISYADTAMNHNGYIYQATNFMYCGLSEKRTDWVLKEGNKHSRGLSAQFSYEEMKADTENFKFVDRSRKHRYIFFLGNKTQVKQLYKDLNYEIQPYPKGESKKYINNKKVAQQMTFI